MTSTSKPWGGTILFMVGSAFFAFASFVNGLNQRSFDILTNQLLTAVTSMYLGVGLFPEHSAWVCVHLPPETWNCSLGASIAQSYIFFT